jgi:hypothetical protein
MSFSANFPLHVSAAQTESLHALQVLFAEACNHLAPIVRETRCWNRVALHHLTYKRLRDRFPQLGSQMVCNVIYSVCRSARVVYQHSGSPWNISKNPTAALPLLRFLPQSPVYFDRHTLSLNEDRLSLYTLDGRMHFKLDISQDIRTHFRNERLREIALLRHGASYALHFQFGEAEEVLAKSDSAWQELPEYLIVQPGYEEELLPVPNPDLVKMTA